jgi:hypothetical protein
MDCSRFQQFDRSGTKLEPSAGWTWNRHGHYDSHIPDTFTFVEFSDELVTDRATSSPERKTPARSPE